MNKYKPRSADAKFNQKIDIQINYSTVPKSDAQIADWINRSINIYIARSTEQKLNQHIDI